MFVFKWWSNILIKERTLISSVFNKTGMWMGTVSLPYDQQNMFSVFCCTTQEAEFPAPRSFVEFLSCWFTPTQKKHLRFHDGFPPPAGSWRNLEASEVQHDTSTWTTLDPLRHMRRWDTGIPQCWDFVHQISSCCWFCDVGNLFERNFQGSFGRR